MFPPSRGEKGSGRRYARLRVVEVQLVFVRATPDGRNLSLLLRCTTEGVVVDEPHGSPLVCVPVPLAFERGLDRLVDGRANDLRYQTRGVGPDWQPMVCPSCALRTKRSMTFPYRLMSCFFCLAIAFPWMAQGMACV